MKRIYLPHPVAIAGPALLFAAALGRSGIVVATVGLAVAGALSLARHRHQERLVLADYVERHSFPSDTVADFACSETGAATLREARERMDAWRSGYLAAERDARRRRSEAAKRAAMTRRERGHR